MTDGPAFLRTIIENPADDAPRLVYADYLDENGFHERAEFIRIQCADPDGESVTIGVSADPHQCAMAEVTFEVPIDLHPHAMADIAIGTAETGPVILRSPKTWKLALLAMDFGDWKLLDPLRNGRIRYRRGFIEAIRLRAVKFLWEAGRLFAAHPIELVQVNHGAVVPAERGHIFLPNDLPPRMQAVILEKVHPLLRARTITEEIALAAISDECVRFGRERTGFPGILTSGTRREWLNH